MRVVLRLIGKIVIRPSRELVQEIFIFISHRPGIGLGRCMCCLIPRMNLNFGILWVRKENSHQNRCFGKKSTPAPHYSFQLTLSGLEGTFFTTTVIQNHLIPLKISFYYSPVPVPSRLFFILDQF